MKLPHGERAFVALEKLSDYCLSPDHEEGKHKARVFQAALGIGPDDAQLLRDALPAAAVGDDAAESHSDEYGQRYIIDFDLAGSGGSARVRSAWIIRTDEDFPRFVSGYVI